MPEVRPGEVHYATAVRALVHGAACAVDNFVGVALKQQAAPAGTGLGAAAITTIAIGEKFIVQIKGRVYLANTVTGIAGATALGAVKGSPVYITLATDLLNIAGPASGTVARFGRVTEVAPERGVAAGNIRVDLDAKDTIFA
jgi:hypothetical protein